MWFTYILTCSDGSFYTGHTNDLKERLQVHNLGGGPLYTVFRRPVQLSYHEVYESKEGAMKREKQIKRWTRAKKQALINGDIKTLKQLSKRKT